MILHVKIASDHLSWRDCIFHVTLASIQSFVVPEVLTAASSFKAISGFSIIFILELILKFYYILDLSSDLFFNVLVRAFYV